MTLDTVLGAVLVVAIAVTYVYCTYLGWMWALRRGWHPVARFVAAVVIGVYWPAWVPVYAVMRWVGWKPKPKYPPLPPLPATPSGEELFGVPVLRSRFVPPGQVLFMNHPDDGRRVAIVHGTTAADIATGVIAIDDLPSTRDGPDLQTQGLLRKWANSLRSVCPAEVVAEGTLTDPDREHTARFRPSPPA